MNGFAAAPTGFSRGRARRWQGASATVLTRMVACMGMVARLLRRQRALQKEIGRLRAEAEQAAASHVREITELRLRLEAEDPGEAFFAALRRVGVLNYATAELSGEARFLRGYATYWPRALILDVGANTGQFATTAREQAPRAIIRSFEPHPVAFARLAERAAGIGVTAEQLALGDSDGEVEIFDYADDAGSQHASVYREVIEGVHHRPAAGVKVRCARLDTLAREHGFGRIGLLKIDTEGHELAVLQGARGLLEAGAIDVIQFEFNEMNVISRVFMKDFFALLPGYRFFRLLPTGALHLEVYDPRFMEVFAYQNIVCIRRELYYGWLLGGD
jgi:FkbM family methyltransferase